MSPQQKDPQFWETLGQRAAIARQRLGMTQADVADRMGFNDRQTVSTVEAGTRKVSLQEMLRLAQILQREIEFFTDPFVLAEPDAFSWRATADEEALKGFEEKAGAWIAAYRHLGAALGETPSPLSFHLPLSPRPSYEECWRAGERLASHLNLGEKPGLALASRAEKDLHLLMLSVDPPDGVSGAACNLPDLKSILVNRNERDGRRHFSTAHELFHLLTWDTVNRACSESTEPFHPDARRAERLADNFAAGLLMPAATVRAAWAKRGSRDIHPWLNDTAKDLGVTSVALKFRVRNLDLVSKADLESIDDGRLTWNGERPTRKTRPRLFSRPFMERMSKAIDRGLISVRRTAELLDTTVEGLAGLFEDHGLDVPFDL